MSELGERVRRAEVLRRRLAGETFAEIAEATGYADRASAWNACQRAVRENLTEPLEDLRTLEAQRLDALQVAVWDRAMSGDLRAVKAVLDVIDARARLFALYAARPSPAQAEAEHLDAEIQALISRMAAE